MIESGIADWIAQKDESLSTLLKYLWNVSKPLHELQNESDGTENGRKHVEMVEHNIWRLIHERHTLGEFNTTELFLLSAGACCHDFDKALRKYNPDTFPKVFKHGTGSADFLRNNLDILGFIEHKHLAKDVARIIEIHDLRGEQFGLEVKKLKRKGKSTHLGTMIRHRLLAVLLKTADILHADLSRNRAVGVNLSSLTEVQKSKYLARSCIAGWVEDGNRLAIQATVTTEEQKNALAACEDFMLKHEWPVVSDFLENYGFPYILQFEIETLVGQSGFQELTPLEILIYPGEASAQELAALFLELSRLYKMMGGSGIDFRVIDARQGVRSYV